MAIKITGLSRRELLALQGRVEKALATLDRQDRKKALEAAEKAAMAHGYKLRDLTGAGAKPAKKGKAAPSKSPARYANPADPSRTWTGKGRRPDWIKAGLGAGKSLKDFEIK